MFIVIFAIILVGKLYMVQIVANEKYMEKAEHQYIAGANYFDRGTIYFSTKDGARVPAAMVRDGYTLAINSSLLQKSGNAEDVYEKLSKITPLDKDAFLAKAGKAGDPYEEIVKRLDLGTAEKIRVEKIGGVILAKERWRTYPGERLASHTLGIIGYKGDELSGRYGLEREYEGTLGRTGDDAFINFFAEIFSNIKKTVSPDDELEGNIVTTLEPSVQSFLEGELEKVSLQYASDFSGGIVIDPNTGEIFALALTPNFDPNYPQRESSSAVFTNKFVEDRYEMGSIIKALTVSAGLDSGAITAGTTYNDPGCMTLNTETFCNYDVKSHGSGVSMQTVLSKSLNTGSAFIVSRMGRGKFAEYMNAFGIGEKTGIDLPNEGNSLVSNLKTNRDLEHAQASFGQGIALTPIGTVRALSAIANGGTLITPHFVKEIEYKLGPSKTVAYPEVDERPRVLKPETSEEISRMLTESVDKTLRDGRVRLEHYSVAAKTGTAQIANPAGGGYYTDRYLHSFFGYFPSYEPRFLIFLYTYYPKNVQYASETLTDTFMETTKFLISYYQIAPDR